MLYFLFLFYRIDIMDNYLRIDEFLKYLAGIIEAGGEILFVRDMFNVIREK